MLLAAIGQIVLNRFPDEFQPAKYMVKKNSDPFKNSKQLLTCIDQEFNKFILNVKFLRFCYFFECFSFNRSDQVIVIAIYEFNSAF